MSRLPSEVKVSDFPSPTQTNGEIITAVSPPDANPGIRVLVLSKCNIRSILRQFKGIVFIEHGGPADLTTLFDKVEFCYLAGIHPFATPLLKDHTYTRP